VTKTLMKAGANVGVNLGAFSDLRAGAYIGRVDATVAIGNPGLPSVSGKQTVGDIVWRYDGQDSPVVPSRGVRTTARLNHIFDEPAISPPLSTGRSSVDLTQFEMTGRAFTGSARLAECSWVGDSGRRSTTNRFRSTSSNSANRSVSVPTISAN
jgi:hypothetical protein